MTRSYDMSTRRRAAEATRQTIIDAAHRLLGHPAGGSLTLQEVADEAGVSRATIYNRVGTRRDVLAAVFEDQGRLIGYDRVLEAITLPDWGEAVVRTVSEGCRAWEVMPGAIRRTLALAVLDEEIGELVAQFDAYRRREIADLAERTTSAPASDIRTRYTASALSLLTSFEAYDHLRRHHDPSQATHVLTQLATAALSSLPHTAG